MYKNHLKEVIHRYKNSVLSPEKIELSYKEPRIYS